MNIGIAVGNNFPLDRDVRIEKIAQTLDNGGHDVTIFARNDLSDTARGQVRDDYDPVEEQLPYATVRRFSWLVGTPVGGLIVAALPFNPFWMAWLTLSLHSDDVDAVIATNLKAGPTAIVSASLLRIPVVVDLRENHSELMKLVSNDGVLERVTRDPRLVRLLERFVTRFSDQLWVVTEERKRFVDDSVPQSKLTVVSNTPRVSDGTETDPEDIFGEYESDRFTLGYVGILNDFRGLDRIIDAISILADRGVDVELLVAGEGPYRNDLEARVERNDVDDRVTFLGWIDRKDVKTFIELADVGLIPHDVTPFTDSTIPHKLFDYMELGVPVLTTDLDPITRIVRREEIGRVIPEGANAETVADIVDGMRTDDDLPEQGRRARESIRERYNWDRESDRILNAVDELAPKAG